MQTQDRMHVQMQASPPTLPHSIAHVSRDTDSADGLTQSSCQIQAMITTAMNGGFNVLHNHVL